MTTTSENTFENLQYVYNLYNINNNDLEIGEQQNKNNNMTIRGHNKIKFKKIRIMKYNYIK